MIRNQYGRPFHSLDALIMRVTARALLGDVAFTIVSNSGRLLTGRWREGQAPILLVAEEWS